MRITKLTPAAVEALSSSTITDNKLTLLSTLDRVTYSEVDKVLKELGGKWNKKSKAHLFDHEPTFEIETIVATGEVMLLSKNGFFLTPRPLAEALVDYADVWEGLSVLEPSAGSGGLADVVRDEHPTARLTCVEIQPKLVAQLRAKAHEVVHADFMSLTPEPIYDRIVMNPPFEQQADIAHITRAFEWLKPGGRMAAIGGGSWRHRSDKKSKAFHELINDFGMMEEDNPAGSFKESGTMVSTRTVVLWKPGE